MGSLQPCVQRCRVSVAESKDSKRTFEVVGVSVGVAMKVNETRTASIAAIQREKERSSSASMDCERAIEPMTAANTKPGEGTI